jgi:hypothetical protein
MQKMKDIDEGQPLPIAPTKDDQPGVEECGMMPMPSMPPKQPDNVDMNVTMHGQGPGGIKDLMQILRNIESGDNSNPHSHDVGALFGGPEVGGEIDVVVDDGYENSPVGASGPETFGIDAVTQTGDDLASKGEERPKVNGGGNPMQEALVQRLSAMYNQIKEEDLDEGMWDNIKQGAQSAVQGVKNAANTVANTTVGDAAKAIGNAAVNYNPVALANKGIQGAAGAIKNAATSGVNAVANKVAAATAPAQAMAPVKPMNAFGGPAQAPEAEFGDLPAQAQFGDLPAQAQFGDLPPQAGGGRGSINPAMAVPAKPTAPAKPAKPTAPAKPGAYAAQQAAFGESSDNLTAMLKIAGLR